MTDPGKKPEPGNTGHEWDGITELNNPLPKWWLYVFYACIAFAGGMFVLYPSIPGIHGYWHGVLGYSARAQAMQDWRQMQGRHAGAMAQIAELPIEKVSADDKLREIAMQAGRIAFANNCAPCHGQGGTGRPGFPALGDDVWLWGGKLADIEKTVTHGIRSTDPETRQSQMPNFGTDNMLKPAEIQQVADYVGVWWGVTPVGTNIDAGQKIFADNCAVCHGDKGQGSHDAGAPPLNAHIHLYGGTHEAIAAQVTHPRNGLMPNWNIRLNQATIRSVAIYVHAMGGGE